jgi:hypothetical protein
MALGAPNPRICPVPFRSTPVTLTVALVTSTPKQSAVQFDPLICAVNVPVATPVDPTIPPVQGMDPPGDPALSLLSLGDVLDLPHPTMTSSAKAAVTRRFMEDS